MALFERVKTPFTEHPQEGEVPLSSGPRPAGELLRERREEFGLTLEQVGAALRIKPAYLMALEEGKPAGLPGPAYAVGFTRSYSNFLGLDSGEVLRRLKAEKADLGRKPDLSFPIPLGERSLPSGSMLLVALILALCGYGAWYYLSNRAEFRAARVGPVPATLFGKMKPSFEPAKKEAASPVPVKAAAPTALASSNPPAVPPAPLSTSAKSESVEPSPSATAPSQTGGAATQEASVAPQTSPSATPPAAAPAIRTLTAPTANPTETPATAPTVNTVAAPAANPIETAAAVPPAHVYGIENSRVVIRANAASWIEVRAADGTIIFQKVLKRGDSYGVPDNPGATLRTGNAGGLSITVDGKPAPSLGGSGSVLRHVALDPRALLSGTAVGG